MEITGETQKTNPDITIPKWGYESHFREYLLLLARKGETALESIDKFPKKIELSADWHDTFEKMRKQTEDGHERWALVGYKEDVRMLIIPTVFGYGENGNSSNDYIANVPYHVMKEQIERAKNKAHVIGVVGDIHTHPENPNAWKSTSLSSDKNGGFSAADLYWLVSKNTPFFSSIMGVVEGRNVYFAFMSKETRKSPFPMDQKVFKNYWEDWQMDSRESRTNMETNINIAKTHNIVLYKGKIGKDLEKISL